jgi:hypothetical protein
MLDHQQAATDCTWRNAEKTNIESARSRQSPNSATSGAVTGEQTQQPAAGRVDAVSQGSVEVCRDAAVADGAASKLGHHAAVGHMAMYREAGVGSGLERPSKYVLSCRRPFVTQGDSCGWVVDGANWLLDASRYNIHVTTEAEYLDSIEVLLRGRPAPDDLRVMVRVQANRPDNADRNSDPLLRTGARVLEPGEHVDLLSHSYLNDTDRADPDIMGNVGAIDEVARHAAWVVEVDNGDVAGYWLHPDEPAAGPPLVIRYDTEGQFHIEPGMCLAEAALYRGASYSDEEFADAANLFAAQGVAVAARTPDELAQRRPVVDPAVLHLRLYNERRIARGEPPVT